MWKECPSNLDDFHAASVIIAEDQLPNNAIEIIETARFQLCCENMTKEVA